jgi:hypothetical protein
MRATRHRGGCDSTRDSRECNLHVMDLWLDIYTELEYLKLVALPNQSLRSTVALRLVWWLLRKLGGQLCCNYPGRADRSANEVSRTRPVQGSSCWGTSNEGLGLLENFCFHEFVAHRLDARSCDTASPLTFPLPVPIGIFNGAVL